MHLAPLLIGLFTVAGAATALALRNVIHSTLLLIASWFGIAAFFLWAGAEFVAFAQVLVYVGAVSMVVLFAVLLTRRSREDLVTGPDSRSRAASAVVASGAVGAVILCAVAGTSFETAAGPAPRLTVRQLGILLMGPQAGALLVVGVILTVALIGAT